MTAETGRSTATVALLVVGVLLVVWVVRFVVGLFVGLAQLVLVVGLALALAYGVVRFWRGWSAAGDDVEAPARRW